METNLNELIEQANSIAVLPAKIAGGDAFCAGVGIYYILKYKDKKATLVYPGKLPEGTENLIPTEEITQDLNEKQLLIRVDYSNTGAEKVHWTTENDILSVTLSPVEADFETFRRIKSELKPLNNFDLVFCIGGPDRSDYGKVLENINGAPIVNIDHTEMNTKFGTVNMIDATKETLSQVVLDLTAQLGLPINSATAKALLTGISYKVNK